MKIKLVYYIVVVFLFASFFSCIFPIPLHKTGYESLSEREKTLYNDAYELEQNLGEDIQNYDNTQ